MSDSTQIGIEYSFPIGRHFRPDAVSSEQLHNAIAAVAALPENLRSAVSGLDDAQLDTPYRVGGWSVRQLVHHVADSHMNMLLRFKLGLTEDWPTITPYPQELWAELADSFLPIEISLTLIESLHRRWVAVLESMTPSQWDRGFVHPETGRHTLAQAMLLYDWHGRHHTAHITELRNRMGW